jgi:hypothetical protein
MSISQPRKRPRTCFADSGQCPLGQTKTGNAAASGTGSSVETDCGRDEEDAKPSLVATSSGALIGSDPDQEVLVQEVKQQFRPVGHV